MNQQMCSNIHKFIFHRLSSTRNVNVLLWAVTRRPQQWIYYLWAKEPKEKRKKQNTHTQRKWYTTAFYNGARKFINANKHSWLSLDIAWFCCLARANVSDLNTPVGVFNVPAVKTSGVNRQNNATSFFTICLSHSQPHFLMMLSSDNRKTKALLATCTLPVKGFNYLLLRRKAYWFISSSWVAREPQVVNCQLTQRAVSESTFPLWWITCCFENQQRFFLHPIKISPILNSVTKALELPNTLCTTKWLFCFQLSFKSFSSRAIQKDQPPSPYPLLCVMYVFKRRMKALLILCRGAGLSKLAMIWHLGVQKLETLQASHVCYRLRLYFFRVRQSAVQRNRSRALRCWLSRCSGCTSHIYRSAAYKFSLIMCLSMHDFIGERLPEVVFISKGSSYVWTMIDKTQVVFLTYHWSGHIKLKCW